MRISPDRYGFLFWFRWITAFAGSFIVSAVVWTAMLSFLFGPIKGEELILTWTLAVFGSWFILVIPFIRKKEQIWKRLNSDQERSVNAWLVGMGSFIGLFIASAVFWSWFFQKRLFPDAPGFDPVWMKMVFSSWLLILVPFLVWMYRKADQIFQDAYARQTYEPRFRTHWIELEKRLLPVVLARQIERSKPTLPGGYLVNAKLKNGNKLEYLFVLNGKEVAGIYDPKALDFDVADLEELSVLENDHLPVFDETKWVRFNIKI